MRRCVLCLVLTGAALTLVPCFAQTDADVKALYEAQEWTRLYRALHSAGANQRLYQGAARIALNQETDQAEKMLLSVMSESPRSDQAYAASEWLSHLYLRSGKYKQLLSVMTRRWTTFPNKKGREQEEAEMAGFRGLPDQITVADAEGSAKHEPGSTFIPLALNGGQADYFLDTGAWVSCMSESEAKRLHLSVRSAGGSMGQSAGSQVAFRSAIVDDVVIGAAHFKNVSFAVFPDDQEPWKDLAAGRRGIIGVPLLLGLRTIRWHKAGTVEFGFASSSFDTRNANLVFDNDHLVISAMIHNQIVRATVDTGAVSTDLYKPFADQFQDLLKTEGKPDTTEVRGVGHAETFESVTLPKLKIRLGGYDASLVPAHVLLKSIGPECCVGNFGMDVFAQTPVMEIDFCAMALRLIAQWASSNR